MSETREQQLPGVHQEEPAELSNEPTFLLLFKSPHAWFQSSAGCPIMLWIWQLSGIWLCSFIKWLELWRNWNCSSSNCFQGCSNWSSIRQHLSFDQTMAGTANVTNKKWMKTATKEVVSLENYGTWREVGVDDATTSGLPDTWVFCRKR